MDDAVCNFTFAEATQIKLPLRECYTFRKRQQSQQDSMTFHFWKNKELSAPTVQAVEPLQEISMGPLLI